jgi:hypothetical protein
VTEQVKKRKKWRVRRPAVIGRSVRLSARGWLRQRSRGGEADAAANGAYQPPPLPRGMAEMSEKSQSSWPHPIFFIIVAVALAFIGLITWLVAHSPAP